MAKSNLFTFFAEDLDARAKQRGERGFTHQDIGIELGVPKSMVDQWCVGHRRIGTSYWRIFDNPLVRDHRFTDSPELREFCHEHGLPEPAKLRLTMQDYLRSTPASARPDPEPAAKRGRPARRPVRGVREAGSASRKMSKVRR